MQASKFISDARVALSKIGAPFHDAGLDEEAGVFSVTLDRAGSFTIVSDASTYPRSSLVLSETGQVCV